MATQRIHIEPSILSWVIERKGLNVENYCKQNVKFAKWISGEAEPTFHQAEEFAKSNYVPLGYLLLPEPPKETMPIPFFRSSKKKVENLNVMDTVKMLGERQLWLSDYLKSENLGNLSFVGSVSTGTRISLAVDKMHQLLNLPDDWAFQYQKVEQALKCMTEQLEDIGCIVVFSSTVGFNSTRSIDVNDCRGFCLVDKDAPFIFVNSKDAKQAQLFTLAHEFAHILLGYSAGLGSNDDLKLSAKEEYCDKLAACFLVPEELFIERWNALRGDIDTLVRKFKVSRFVIARRANELGLMQNDQYWSLIDAWKEEPIREQIRKSGPVKFEIRAVRSNGHAFLVHVNNAVNSQKLLYRDAFRLTGMRGETYRSVIRSKYFMGI